MQTARLYIVATPIGNLDDFSARAIQTLKSVDTILAEDTRHSKPLLAHFGIKTPMQAYHEHNEVAKSLEVIAALQQGHSYALISDAGTPVFSDPGAKLVAAALEAGCIVVPIPGACAAIAGLSASGLMGIPFHFYGFLPVKASPKRKLLEGLQKHVSGTLCFYESPHRLMETLSVFTEVWGDAQEMVLAKELTKLFETIRKDSIVNILSWLEEDPKRQQGEFVLLLENGPIQTDAAHLSISLDTLLVSYLKHAKLKAAVAEVVELTGLSKNFVYERALALKQH